jgi:hypothetical protein
MSLSGYNYIDLCQKAGAIQLVPENADYYAELVRNSAVIAAVQESACGPFRITDFEFDCWINSPELMKYGPEMRGDPLEGLLVAEIQYRDAGYLVMPVEYAEDAFILQCLLEAASRGVNLQCAQTIASVALLGLTISDICLRRAGVSRHTEPSSSEDDHIVWPRGSGARHLEDCVFIERGELERRMAQIGVDTSGLDRLGFRQDAVPATYDHVLQNPVRRRPILITDEGVVLISPMTVNNAVRDAVIQIATEIGAIADLLEGYRAVVAARVDVNARRLGWTQRASDRIAIDDMIVEERVYSADVDKVMVTYLVTDNFTHGDTAIERSYWNAKPSIAAITRRIAINTAQLQEVFGQGIEIVHCALTQGVGRSHVVGVPKSNTPNVYTVWCSADDFQVFSLLNLGGSLALWRVAVSRHRRPAKALLGTFLDHYALYRSRDESYYFGDEGTPDFAVFVASGIGLRLEVARTLDPHMVPSADGNAGVLVFRFESRPNFAVYCQEPGTGDGIALFVECLPCPTWVVNSDSCDVSTSEKRSACFHLIDTVAFWLWQLTPDILTLVGDATGPSRFIIEVDSTAFEPTAPSSSEPQTTGLEYKQRSKGRGQVIFGSEFASRCARPDNAAELDLARLLLRSFLAEFDVEVNEDAIETIVAAQPSNGHKRRMAIIQGTAAGLIDTQGLPRPDTVQPFDEQMIQDDLAETLSLAGAINEGTLPASERHNVLNQAVVKMHEWLQALVSVHSSEELIVEMVARQESLIGARRHYEQSTNTHLAGFGRSEKNIRELQREIAEVDKASIANRFLIEYAAAKPPHGKTPLSQSAYLRLLALAAAIFRTGQLSDSVRYKLSEHTISLLKSRRMEIQDAAYDAAMTEFHNAFFDRVVASGASEREQRSQRRSQREEANDQELSGLEAATKAEFGFSISDMCRFLSCIAGSPFTGAAGVGHCEIGDLRAHVENALPADAETVDRLLDILCFRERPDYLKPPAPYKALDVYPWVFNRRLSYLRRPLVVHGDLVTWGTRAIHQAGNYLFDICLRGRLKDPVSKEMKLWQGAVVNRIGNSFNNEIADLIRSTGEYVVRTRVKKFNGRRLAREDGNDLGDIDVFAVNVSAKVVLPIETKCFSMAKTAAEVARERDELFGDATGSDGKLARHLERTAWLHSHFGDVLAELGTENTGDWTVQPLIVLDVDLISVHLVSSPIKIATRETLFNVLREAIESLR